MKIEDNSRRTQGGEDSGAHVTQQRNNVPKRVKRELFVVDISLFIWEATKITIPWCNSDRVCQTPNYFNHVPPRLCLLSPG